MGLFFYEILVEKVLVLQFPVQDDIPENLYMIR